MSNFVISADGKTFEKYIGTDVHVIVPDGVEKIGYEAFRMSKVESVKLPEGIKEISSYAFYGCMSLKNLNIPDSIEFIGIEPFGQCLHLKELQLPNKKISFADAAFRNTYFSTFSLPDQTEEIRDNMFNGSMNLNMITIPSKVKAICQYAFNWCTSLRVVHIKNGVESIMHRAFYKAISLQEVYIPESVTVLGSCAFELCECLKDVYVDWKSFPDFIKDNDNLFTGVCLKYVTLHVPHGTIEMYKSHPSFSKFAVIKEID